jgi:hypothetical protein
MCNNFKLPGSLGILLLINISIRPKNSNTCMYRDKKGEKSEKRREGEIT